jgi:hypothetical protein
VAAAPNTWYCDRLPEEVKPMEKWEQAMRDFIHQRHPEFALDDENGQPIPLGQIPLAYTREYTKSVNPNAVFEVDGISVDELIAILDRHRDELRRMPGYTGSGIDKDGIWIERDSDRSVFPDTLEGAKVHFKPYRLLRVLGSRLL